MFQINSALDVNRSFVHDLFQFYILYLVVTVKTVEVSTQHKQEVPSIS